MRPSNIRFQYIAFLPPRKTRPTYWPNPERGNGSHRWVRSWGPRR